MKRIIYVDNFLLNHGHTPTTGLNLINNFKTEGYKVIHTSNKNNKILRLLDMVFTIFRHRKNAIVLIATYSELAFYFASICALTCRLLNIQYIPTLHGGHLPRRIKKSPNLSKMYFGNSYTNVAVSGYLGSLMKSNGWKCVEIPNNIPIKNYPFRQRDNIGPKLFWVRSFHENYNPQLALHILHKLLQKYPDATLTMVGPDKDDDSLAKCRQLAIQLNIADKVIFTGLMTQKEWIAMSSSFDIFINTTNIDNLPVSVIEAMALGMVIISTSVGGVPFLIENEINGLLVSPNNVDAFLSAIEKVLTEKSFAFHLSKNARQKAEKYDWKNVKLLWKDLFYTVSN